MVRQLALISFTDEGVRQAQQSADRAKSFRTEVESAGGKVVGLYWGVGAYDGAVIFEAPDEATAAALLLNLGRHGSVRTQTLRLFDADEFQDILNKM